MGALPKRYFTPEEYLLLEEQSPYKSQYIAGEIFPMGEDVTGSPSAMGGAHPVHARVVTNITISLGGQFRGRNCQVFSAGLRVAATPGEMYTYPDVVALCGEPKYETARNPPSLLNPQVICEVLSPRTEAYDRGEKFIHYQRLGTLTDYLLVSVDAVRIDHHVRQESGGWLLSIYHRLEQRTALASVGSELPLAEIYDKVMFSHPVPGHRG